MRLIAIILLTLFASLCSASTDSDNRLWLNTNISNENGADKTWLYLGEAELRFFGAGQTFDGGVVRGTGGYRVNENLSYWVGMDWVRTFKDETIADNVTYETRLWEQVKWTMGKNDHHSFASRTRLEQRMKHGNGQIALRLRERLKFEWPDAWRGKITPVVYDEVFFNLNRPDWIAPRTFDRNRLFLGGKIALSKRLDLEAGYLNQYRLRSPNNQMDNILYIELAITPQR